MAYTLFFRKMAEMMSRWAWSLWQVLLKILKFWSYSGAGLYINVIPAFTPSYHSLIGPSRLFPLHYTFQCQLFYLFTDSVSFHVGTIFKLPFFNVSQHFRVHSKPSTQRILSHQYKMYYIHSMPLHCSLRFFSVHYGLRLHFSRM